MSMSGGWQPLVTTEARRVGVCRLPSASRAEVVNRLIEQLCLGGRLGHGPDLAGIEASGAQYGFAAVVVNSHGLAVVIALRQC